MPQLLLDRYQLIDRAGSGGFGAVYVAWDTRIQRKVAIKVIPLSAIDAARATFPGNAGTAAAAATGAGVVEFSQEEESRWLADVPGLDEARTAAMLQDANIVAVYDVEIYAQRAFLIMEYVEGITLTQLLRNHNDELTLDMIAALFQGMAHALEVAHRRKVLHLDIKPDNILINADGQVKVTDFGLATLADAQGYGTAGGGTVGYMPLEQMRSEPLDARTDEWSLASITYEMLAGRNPFFANDLEEAQRAIEDAELVLPSACWDNLDPEVDDIMFCALCPDPQGRYKKVKDFREDLLPFLGDPKAGCADLVDAVYEEMHPVYDTDGEYAEDVAYGGQGVAPASPRMSTALFAGFIAVMVVLFAAGCLLVSGGHFAPGIVLALLAVVGIVVLVKTRS